jgi:hypothetical protein
MRRPVIDRWRQAPVVNGVQEVTLTLVANNSDVVLMRRNTAADVIAHQLRLVSFDEDRGRLTTKLKVTVAGHPLHIRQYREALRGQNSSAGWSLDGSGGADDLLFGIVAEVVVDAVVAPSYRAAKHRWQGRNDPPLDQDALTALDRTRTIVNWTRVAGDLMADPLGSVTLDLFVPDSPTSHETQEWLEPVRRSVAQAYAAEHDHIFVVED